MTDNFFDMTEEKSYFGENVFYSLEEAMADEADTWKELKKICQDIKKKFRKVGASMSDVKLRVYHQGMELSLPSTGKFDHVNSVDVAFSQDRVRADRYKVCGTWDIQEYIPLEASTSGLDLNSIKTILKKYLKDYESYQKSLNEENSDDIADIISVLKEIFVKKEFLIEYDKNGVYISDKFNSNWGIEVYPGEYEGTYEVVGLESVQGKEILDKEAKSLEDVERLVKKFTNDNPPEGINDVDSDFENVPEDGNDGSDDLSES